MRRPNLAVDDAKAIERLAPSVDIVDIWLGGGGPGNQVVERVSYRGERTPPISVLGATEQFAAVNFVRLSVGRFFTEAEVRHRRRVVVLGNAPYQALFAPSGLDPIGKKVRIGAIEYTVVGVLAPRPSPFPQADDFLVIPQTTHEVVFNTDARRTFGGQASATITVMPHASATREQAATEVEEILRIRHGLRLDEPNDFDIAGQDAILRVWDQVSQATFLALVVISSVALMVGGIGVMAIMTISVTERTREVGVRKALGARRRDVLVQFLAEAIVLTLVGGLLGILLGSAIGIAIGLATGFPISLPWWSFAIGIGFSASVGVFFGIVPAVRASRLDPIEALRHE
jgi:putative ABC transport system permease protein